MKMFLPVLLMLIGIIGGQPYSEAGLGSGQMDVCPGLYCVSNVEEFAEWWICKYVQHRRDLHEWKSEMQKRQTCLADSNFKESLQDASPSTPADDISKDADLTGIPSGCSFENEGSGFSRYDKKFWRNVGREWEEIATNSRQNVAKKRNLRRKLGEHLGSSESKFWEEAGQKWGKIWDAVRRKVEENPEAWHKIGLKLGEDEGKLWRKFGLNEGEFWRKFGRMWDDQTDTSRNPTIDGERDFGSDGISIHHDLQRMWNNVWKGISNKLGHTNALWRTVGRELGTAEGQFWQHVGPILRKWKEAREADNSKPYQFNLGNSQSISGNHEYFRSRIQPALHNNPAFWEEIRKMLDNDNNDVWQIIRETLSRNGLFWEEIRSKISSDDTFWTRFTKILQRDDKFWSLLPKTLGENRAFWNQVQRKLSKSRKFWAQMQNLIEGDDGFWQNLVQILTQRDEFWEDVRREMRRNESFFDYVRDLANSDEQFWDSLGERLPRSDDLWRSVRRVLQSDKKFWQATRQLSTKYENSDEFWRQIRHKIASSNKADNFESTERDIGQSWAASFPNENIVSLVWGSVFKCPQNPEALCQVGEKQICFTDDLGCDVCYCPDGKYKEPTDTLRRFMKDQMVFADAMLLYDYLIPACKSSETVEGESSSTMESSLADLFRQPLFLRWIISLIPFGIPPLPSRFSATSAARSKPAMLSAAPATASTKQEVSERITTMEHLVITKPLAHLFAGKPASSRRISPSAERESPFAKTTTSSAAVIRVQPTREAIQKGETSPAGRVNTVSGRISKSAISTTTANTVTTEVIRSAGIKIHEIMLTEGKPMKTEESGSGLEASGIQENALDAT